MILSELKDKKYYWVKSIFYNEIIPIIAQFYLQSNGQHIFELLGSDHIYYAHYFEILQEIPDYETEDLGMEMGRE